MSQKCPTCGDFITDEEGCIQCYTLTLYGEVLEPIDSLDGLEIFEPKEIDDEGDIDFDIFVDYD
jgi:hypothetical protein